MAGTGITKAIDDTGGSKRLALSVDAALVQLRAELGVASGYAPLDSGVLVLTAYLTTGTPDGTTFLRGDRVWAVPPDGSNSGEDPIADVFRRADHHI